jgi:DNA-directed RNA polymerase specialized sigma24 family protein
MTTRVAPGAPDEALAVAARGNARHFELLYRRYADRIYAYALSRTGLPELADDLVGDPMLAALENLYRFDSKRGSSAS